MRKLMLVVLSSLLIGCEASKPAAPVPDVPVKKDKSTMKGNALMPSEPN
jgi:uncharacterized protein YcfL